VLFNPGLNHNDGLLAASVARREGMNYDCALEAILREVDAMRSQLAGDGEVAISGIGLFRHGGPDLSPVFEPMAGGVVNAPYAFLGELKIFEEPAGVSAAAGDSACGMEKIGRRHVVPAFLRIAAAVALLLIFGFTLTVPSGIQNDGADYASMPGGNPARTVVSKASGEAFCPQLLSISVPQANDALCVVDTVANKVYRHAVARIDAWKERCSVRAGERGDESAFCIVVASFESERKARRYIRQIGDNRLRISRSGGYYRVYSASSDSREEARMLRVDEAKRFPGAWICEQ